MKDEDLKQLLRKFAAECKLSPQAAEEILRKILCCLNADKQSPASGVQSTKRIANVHFTHN